MRASSLAFRAAVLLVIVGMGWGIVMAASQDHATAPAHAHLNLLGWVSLFLFGIFYRLHPTLETSRAAVLQLGVWILGTIGLTAAVGLIHTGRAAGEPIAAVSSVILLSDMLLFAVLVFRSGRAVSATAPGAIPAE